MSNEETGSPTAGQSPCSAQEAGQFDFWLGQWEGTWGEDGRGTNRIAKTMGGCVVEEQFDGGAFKGMSVSVYDERQGCWKQTWVDNAGSYLDFTGGMTGGRMILSRQAEIDGQVVQQRMVWYDIEADRFEWHWERSEDGQSWQVLWHIHYRRTA
jgi:hypothetical protein